MEEKKHFKKEFSFDKRAFTIREAAEYACVSRGTVDNWLSKGILPFEELPSRGKGNYCFRRIRKSDLDEFLNKFYSNNHSLFSNKHSDKSGMFLLPRVPRKA
jgi:excisionase family DNA binding protein